MLQAGDCQFPLAEESAAEVTALLRGLRRRLPQTRMVLLAPLPKGDSWPNRCMPAFRVFNDALQVNHPFILRGVCSIIAPGAPKICTHRLCDPAAVSTDVSLMTKSLV